MLKKVWRYVKPVRYNTRAWTRRMNRNPTLISCSCADVR